MKLINTILPIGLFGSLVNCSIANNPIGFKFDIKNIKLLESKIRNRINQNYKSAVNKYINTNAFIQATKAKFSNEFEDALAVYDFEVTNCYEQSKDFWQKCQQCVFYNCNKYYEKVCDGTNNLINIPKFTDNSPEIKNLREMLEELSLNGMKVNLNYEPGLGAYVVVNAMDDVETIMKMQSRPSKFVKRDADSCGYINILCSGNGCETFDLNQQVAIECGEGASDSSNDASNANSNGPQELQSNDPWTFEILSGNINLKTEPQSDGRTKVIIELNDDFFNNRGAESTPVEDSSADLSELETLEVSDDQLEEFENALENAEEIVAEDGCDKLSCNGDKVKRSIRNRRDTKDHCESLQKTPHLCFQLDLKCDDCEMDLDKICPDYALIKEKLSLNLARTKTLSQRFQSIQNNQHDLIRWYQAIDDGEGHVNVYIQRAYFNPESKQTSLSIAVGKGDVAKQIIMEGHLPEDIDFDKFSDSIAEHLGDENLIGL